MQGRRCKLYDENLVRNIMLWTGTSVFEYLSRKRGLSLDDVCEFVDLNADHIIENTIEDMNSHSEAPEDEEDDEVDPDLDEPLG